MANWGFRWNYTGKALLYRTGFDDETNRYFAEKLLDAVEDDGFTPLKSGALRDSAHADERGLTYDVNYADKQYQLETPNRYTPGTYGHWVRMSWNLHKQHIVRQVSGHIGAKSRRRKS